VLRAGVPQGGSLGQCRAAAPARRRPAPDLAAPPRCRTTVAVQAGRRVMTGSVRREEVSAGIMQTGHEPAPTAERSDARTFGHPGVAPSALPMRLLDTEWLHHRLTVSGPAQAVVAFAASAQGAGTIPWWLDASRIEEDLFHRLIAPPAPQTRSLSLEGARALARQLTEASVARHAAALARVGISRACPFDLHALVPVPPDMLRLGGRTTGRRLPGCGCTGARRTRCAMRHSSRHRCCGHRFRSTRQKSATASGRRTGRRGEPSRCCGSNGRCCAWTSARPTTCRDEPGRDEPGG